MKRILNIYEELSDINKTPFNIHWTNPHSLIGMFEDGYITGSFYNPSNSLQKNKNEIATLRRSEDKRFSNLKRKGGDFSFELENLSSNIDGVKIYLFMDRIKTAVRSVKKYPISEYSVSDLKGFERQIGEIYKRLAKMKALTMNLKEFKELFKRRGNKIVESLKISGLMIRQGSEPVREMFLIIKKEFKLDIDEEENIEWYIRLALKSLQGLKKNKREGEERITYDIRKIKGIPIKPEFMKIRFVKVDESKYKDYIKLVPFMEENKKLFVIDKNFKEVIKIGKEGMK